VRGRERDNPTTMQDTRSSDQASRRVQRESRQREAGRRAARRAQEQAAARQRRLVVIAAAAIVLVIAALIVFRQVSSSSPSGAATASGPAPESVVNAVTGVDAAALEQVGRGTVSQLPTPVRTDIQRGPDGLPQITYVGAEYCPFCAGERWPMIVALSRFGTFSNLQLSHSASNDVYPNTPTFTFVGSTYTSPYINFNPVELQSNVPSGSGYQQLQTPTPDQSSLLQKYDGPPYVPASGAGSIPFIDFAGQYIISGATYDVGTLRGMTQEQVATALQDPTSPQAQAILGSANAITAAICASTGNMPTDVCTTPAVASLQATMAATPVPGQS
jgi:hypothetical protein